MEQPQTVQPLPARIDDEVQLEDFMTTPSAAVIEALGATKGDIVILGVGGKMGPTLARLARRALGPAGRSRRVIGVARFSNPEVRRQLESVAVETITADLLEPGTLGRLPEAPNVIYLAARKFGSTGNEPLTWAMNTYLPACVADRYRHSRIVALSTGNVYPLVPVRSSGPTEEVPPGPVGEYAQSCLGRERMFQYLSQRHGTAVTLIRLNYAIDLRYGILLDVATKVHGHTPIDLAMGYVNVIWQGDANAAILRSLTCCASPPFILNLTGPRTVPVRWLAQEFGRRLNVEPVFTGSEQSTALLSNSARYVELMGPPVVSLERMMDWVAHWVSIGGSTLNKPTHYEVRDGKF